MRVGLLGRKVGMTQIYEADGTAVPITVLECGPCTVLQVRTEERDGYHAVQLGYADKNERTRPKRRVATPRKWTPNPSDTSASSVKTGPRTSPRVRP